MSEHFEAAIEQAAQSIYNEFGEHGLGDEALEDAYAATWPGGENAWYGQEMASDDAESHRERVFRAVVGRLGQFCQRRAAGDKPWTGA